MHFWVLSLCPCLICLTRPDSRSIDTKWHTLLFWKLVILHNVDYCNFNYFFLIIWLLLKQDFFECRTCLLLSTTTTRGRHNMRKSETCSRWHTSESNWDSLGFTVFLLFQAPWQVRKVLFLLFFHFFKFHFLKVLNLQKWAENILIMIFSQTPTWTFILFYRLLQFPFQSHYVIVVTVLHSCITRVSKTSNWIKQRIISQNWVTLSGAFQESYSLIQKIKLVQYILS